MIKQQENVQSLNTNSKFKITLIKKDVVVPDLGKSLLENWVSVDKAGKIVILKEELNKIMAENTWGKF